MTDTTASLDPLAGLVKGVWWWVLIRGILAIAFGIVALISPAVALTAIAIVFGAYTLVDGIMLTIAAIQTRKTTKGWGWVLAQGILSVLVGLAALILPGLVGALGGLVVLWTIVFWNIMTGIASIQAATKSEAGSAKTWMIVAGVVSLVFAVILAIAVLVTPGVTLLGLIWAVGIYAIVFGIMLIVTAIHVRRLGRTLVTAAD
ncbi:DUF308 domain-containing protein [Leifsonia sp. H3M29-4]|uniref:HdeD family acid-resistance protein n=1 Tax=Salinibacterium metalliresistens TaxID=3031321 RepID=UPI0023DCD182|nr:DUF308 domain-containing protein [Salinibacterium metalliresistens]MDF1479924.1 DUF308 domain-containing protein [Salinibacterium metalliresistens]